MADRRRILDLLATEEEKQLAARILEKQALAEEHGRPQLTDFLDPAQQTLAGLLMQQAPGLAYDFVGGYPKAERRRLVLRPRAWNASEVEDGISAVNVSGDFRFEPLTHRDLLGAVMSLGLKREKIGDIVVGEAGGQVLVVAELAPTLEARLQQVGKTPVTAREVAPEEIAAPAERLKEVKTTVASLRLDAVASSGFGTSRAQMTREIKGMRVRLNWRPTADPAAEVKPGDVISLRGRGRVVVAEITGTTKKGRTGLLLERYM